VQIGKGVQQGCCLSPILFNLYSEYLIKEALDGLGDFNIRGHIMQTVKYTDDLVLMAKEETVLQGMIDKLSEIGRYYGMEMNVEKTKLMRMRVGGSIKTQLSQDHIHWLDNDDMFQPCLAIFRP